MGGFRSTTTNETKSYDEQQNPPYTHNNAATYICSSINHSQLGFKTAWSATHQYFVGIHEDTDLQ